ncbi:MAG: hypothetical protein CMJ23_13510 [Phycisphaerae bacterium]|nr:hypothetical protein [Phycisphaerae bacterium]
MRNEPGETWIPEIASSRRSSTSHPQPDGLTLFFVRGWDLQITESLRNHLEVTLHAVDHGHVKTGHRGALTSPSG